MSRLFFAFLLGCLSADIHAQETTEEERIANAKALYKAATESDRALRNLEFLADHIGHRLFLIRHIFNNEINGNLIFDFFIPLGFCKPQSRRRR